ncbi:YhdP family protein [Hydrogenimonas sp.]
MITTTAKILHSAVLKIILILFLLLVAFALVLAHGVTIDHIGLPGLKVKALYIKLDEKLILEAREVDILPSSDRQASGSVEELERIGNLLRFIPAFFEKIQVDDLHVGSRRAQVLFYDDIFYLATDELQLATRLAYDPQDRSLEAKVKILYLVDADTIVRGDFFYLPRERRWQGEGRFEGLNLRGDFSLWKEGDRLGFLVSTDETDSIAPLVDFLAPPEPIKVWIYPKIPARRYILHYLRGEVRLDGGRISIDPEKIEGYATAWDARIRFHPDVPPVTTPRIDVRYRHDTLSFALEKPRYEGKALDGSYVRIRHLIDHRDPTELDAHIVVTAPFDASISRILSAYRIPVPFLQTEGVMRGVTDLIVALKNGRIVAYRGDYRIAEGRLLFDGVLPVNVRKLHVTADRLRFRIEPCRAAIAPYLTADLSGELDLGRKRGRFDAALVGGGAGLEGVKLFNLAGKKVRANIDFSDRILFTFPDLSARLRYLPGGGLSFEADDLSRLRPFLAGPLKPIEAGTLKVRYKEGEGSLRAEVDYPNEIFLYRGRPFERIDIDATFGGGRFDARFGHQIHVVYDQSATTIRYEDLDIYFLKLRDLLKRSIPVTSDTAVKKSGGGMVLRLYGTDTRLRSRFAYLPCDRFEMKVTTRPFSVLFESYHGQGKIYALMVGDDVKVVGKRLPSRVMRGIPALRNLYGGYFDFDAVGKIDDFNGTLTFQDTLWKKNAVYNNLIATLNTIPAILSLKNPGFNPEGFKIKRGAIRYHYRTPLFHFDSISIQGESANIYGKGAIDFAKEWIDLKMKVQFLQSMSNFMHKIPIAGYILFGDDGTIAVGLTVEGPLGDPKVETSAAKDIATAPVNILKRTVTFPFHLFK